MTLLPSRAPLLGDPTTPTSGCSTGPFKPTGPHSHSPILLHKNGGTYTCVATNNAGSGIDFTDIYVHPYIVRQPELNVFTANGEFS